MHRPRHCMPTMLLFFCAALVSGFDQEPRCDFDVHLLFLNCSCHGWTSVPTREFLSHTRGIDLSFNNISVVKNRTFTKLLSLEFLDLSNNIIKTLESSAFEGLANLLTLNLSFNHLEFTSEVFTPQLFAPLENLRSILIKRSYGMIHPLWEGLDAAFGKLTNLTTFIADLPYLFCFEEGFRQLTKLNKISNEGQAMNNYCGIGVLYNNVTFRYLKNIPLRELRLINCDINIIFPGAFDDLISLEVLDLSYNNFLGLHTALQSLRSFHGRNMTEINFAMVNTNAPDSNNTVVNSEDFAHLSAICVKSVDLSQNSVVSIDVPVQPRLWLDCLEKLNISYHSFLEIPLNLRLHGSKTLKYLDLSHERAMPQHKHDMSVNKKNLIIVYTLPPTLFWLSFSSCWNWFTSDTEVTFSRNNLRYLELAFVNIDQCRDMPMRGLSNLTSIDLSGMSCPVIYPQYFQYLRSITKLSLANSVQMDLALTSTTLPFVLLNILEEIDLSENNLFDIHQELFHNNTQLKSVNLANNKLQRLPKTVQDVSELKVLDLTSNVFTHLQTQEMRTIDNWLAKSGSFELRLGNNPLQCTCDTIMFTRWIVQMEDILDNPNSYTCLLSNGTRLPFSTFRKLLTDFEVQCVSHTYLIISVVSVSTLIVLLLLFAGIYRYRLNLRYWLYTKLMPPEDMFVDQVYTYDAFVAYTCDDYEWVIRMLRPKLELVDDPIRLCVHDRDFIPGKPIHENIVDKMKESRKILLIISQGFLESRFGPLEIEYAGMKCLEEGRDDTILCVLMEDIPVRKMPRALRNLWHKITFLKWSDDAEQEAIFWRNLRAAVTPGRH
ncbi:toll-like receptor 2 [Liolophura sinensis]|uniref:toll-like receptor 2 n=1 Tax=Liolophura sinensis TaxID=3198878 RepID=UPI00315853C9